MKNFQDRFVSLRDAEGEGAGAGGGSGAAAGGGVDVAALQAELATLKAADAAKAKELETAKQTISEKEQAAQFWHGKATAKGPGAGGQTPVEDEPAVDLLDLIANKGTKGLTGALKKEGIVTIDQVNDIIAQNVDRITREGKAVERFPELKDQNSELFKLTRAKVAELAKDGIKGVAATEIGVERAYLQLVDEGKMKPLAVRRAEAEAAIDEDGETEAERIARANAAGGSGGRRAAVKDRRPVETPEETRMIKSMCEQFGITEKQFRERAEKGINFGG